MRDQTNYQYDVFVSYADADREWVEGYLLDALEKAGVRYHSEEAFELGEPRLVSFEKAVKQSQRTLLVLSPDYLGDSFSQFTDLLAQSYGLEVDTWPVIPLILKPVEPPPRIKMLNSLDATNPEDWPGVLERLCEALQRPAPGPAPKPACPYPGMVPFSEQDSNRFFGRDQEIQELVECLRLYPFRTVIGPSGSGKSSLVFAGLIPALRKSSLFGSGEWKIRSFRPGAAPQKALTMILGDNLENPSQAVAQILEAEREADAQRILLVVDQFEEIFTQAGPEAILFQQTLLRLIEVPNCYLVLTVRADFYVDLMAGLLWPTIKANRTEVTPLTDAGLRQAIVGPAEDVDVFVETALVERLVTDAAGEPGVLPMVQETLVLLWQHLERRFLPLKAYEALILSRRDYGGPERTGLQVAMARRADAALAGLKSEEQQAIARRIFLRLIQFGEGRADTRRQQPVRALRSAGEDSLLFDETLKKLTDSRLLTLSGEEHEIEQEEDVAAHRKVDIAHEALISGWPKLQEWLDERREAEQIRRRLEAKAAEWNRLGQSTGGLLDETELPEAEHWLASPDAADLGYNKVLPVLVQTSRARQRRSMLVRSFAVGAIIVSIIAALWIGLWSAQRDAQRQKTIARQQEEFAQEQQRLADKANHQRQQAEQSEKETKRQLAKNYWTNGVNARDNDGDALKAGHYFMRTAVLTDDPKLLQNTRLAGDLLASGVHLGTILEHADSVNGALFAHDDRRILTWSADGTARLWDSVSGELLVTLEHADSVRNAVFSHDQHLILTWTDKVVRIWNSMTGQPLMPPIEHEGRIAGATFSQDERRILIWGSKVAQVWDISTGQSLIASVEHEDRIKHATFISPDERRVLTWSDDGIVKVWDSTTGKLLLEPLRHGINGPLLSVSTTDEHRKMLTWEKARERGPVVSQDGQRLLTWSGKTLQVLDSMSGEALTPPLEYESSVLGATFSQDERRILAWSWDGTVRLWSSTDGQQLTPPLEHDSEVRGAVFSPDERKILTWSRKIARVWSSVGGQPLTPPLRHEHSVYEAVFNHDGHRILTWGGDYLKAGVAQAWDSNVGWPFFSPLEHKREVKGALFSRDGYRIITWCGDDTARIWDSEAGQALTPPLKNAGNGVVLSRDERRILTWGDNSARVWELDKNSAFAPLMVGKDWVRGAVFNQNATRILTWNRNTAQVLDSATGTALIPPLEHTDTLEGALFSPDETRILTWGGRIVRVWDSENGRALMPPLEHTSKVNGAIFNQDGTRFLTWCSWDSGYRAGIAWLRDSETGEALTSPLTHKRAVKGAVFSPDGRWILSWSGYSSIKDGTARIWDSETGEPRTPPMEHEGEVSGAIFSRDTSMVLTWSTEDDTARLWDSATGKLLIPPLEHGDRRGAVFSPDERRILTWKHHSAYVWDSATGEALFPALEHKPWLISAAFFSPTGDLILTRSGKEIRVWDSSTGQPLTLPMKHQDNVVGARFSRDERRILTWGGGYTRRGAVRLWDSATGKPLSLPMTHEDEVWGAVFSKDENRILTWSADATVRLWDGITGQPLIPPLQHPFEVKKAIFDPQEERILTWNAPFSSAGSLAQVWSLYTDYDFPREYLVLQMEVQTGTRLNDLGEIETLSSDTWLEKRREYEEVAREHLKNGQYPHANLFLNALMARPESCERPGEWMQQVNPTVLSEAATEYARTCLDRGSVYLNQKKYEHAIRAFETALQLQTDYLSADSRLLAEIYERIARTLFQSGQELDRGMQYVQKSLELNPQQDPALALHTLAFGYRQKGQDMLSSEAYLTLGRAYMRWQAYPSAMIAYQTAFDLDPGLEERNASEYSELKQRTAEYHLTLAEDYWRQKKREEAIQKYEEAFRCGSEDSKETAKWYFELARKLIADEIYIDKGIAYAHKSLELHPQQASKYSLKTVLSGYRKKALIQSRKGQYREAVEILHTLARFSLTHKQYEDAAEEYVQIGEKDPQLEQAMASSEYPEVHYILGRAYTKQRKFADAVREYEQAIHYGFDDAAIYAICYYDAAGLLIQQDIDIDKGIAYARKSLQLDPQQGFSYAMRMLILGYSKKVHGYGEEGRHSEALQALQQLTAIYLERKGYSSAIRDYERIMKTYPHIAEAIASSEHAELHYVLSELYYKHERYAEAVREYERALQYGFDDSERTAEFRNKLGQALIDHGIDVDKGRKYLQGFQEPASDQEAASLALASYFQYFRLDNHAQWLFPGRNPNKIIGPEPWRRDIWVGRTGDYPYIGIYDNVTDREIIRWHIRLAKAAGIKAFLLHVFDWQNERPQIDLLLDVAARENFKVGFVDNSFMIAKSREADPLNQPLEHILEHTSGMLNQWKLHQAYLRIDGKALVVIPIMNPAVTPSDCNAFIKDLTSRVTEDVYVVAISPHVYQYFLPVMISTTGLTQKWANTGIDSFTHWAPNGMITASQETRIAANEFVVEDSRKWKKDAMIPVMPGFDDDSWRPGDVPVPTAPRENGKAWGDQLDAALSAEPRFLFIVHWNEWHEGSQIEPSTYYSDPYLYLKILAQKLQKPWQTPPLPPQSSVDPLRVKYLPY